MKDDIWSSLPMIRNISNTNIVSYYCPSMNHLTLKKLFCLRMFDVLRNIGWFIGCGATSIDHLFCLSKVSETSECFKMSDIDVQFTVSVQ